MSKKKFDFKDHYNTVYDADFWCVAIAIISGCVDDRQLRADGL